MKHYDWTNNDALIENFVSLANGNDEQQLSIGYEALREKLNAAAQLRWDFVTSSQKIERYVQLKSFENQFLSLTIKHDHSVTTHLAIVINLIAKSMDKEELAAAETEVQKILMENFICKTKTSLVKIAEYFKTRNIIDKTVHDAYLRKLNRFQNDKLCSDELRDEISKLKESILSLPMVPNKRNSLALNRRPPAKHSLKYLAKLTIETRNEFDTRNGIALSVHSIQESLKPHSSDYLEPSGKLIKSSLPLFKRGNFVTTKNTLGYVHQTKLGSVVDYGRHFNFITFNNQRAAKLAIKLASKLGWPTIHAWGETEYTDYLETLGSKNGIEVRVINKTRLKYFKQQIETETICQNKLINEQQNSLKSPSVNLSRYIEINTVKPEFNNQVLLTS